MNWPLECAAVIPCLNEEAAIASLVAKVKPHLPTILVVDDGSTDRTANFAGRAGAEVLKHATTRGKGAALRTGWQAAGQRGFKWVCTLDGDGQHAPEDIPAFFRCAEETGAHLVVGNRMSRPDRMPLIRRRVNQWMSRRLSSVAGRSLPDTQCGFRLIMLQPLSSLAISTAHFEIESEILLAWISSGFKVEFIPIQVIYKDEQSKIHALRDTVRWFGWLRSWKRQNKT